MRPKFLLILLAVVVAAFMFGTRMGRGPHAPAGIRPAVVQPPKPIEPPTTEELKVWARQQALTAEFKFPDPEGLEKLSEEKRQAKFQETAEARKKHEENVLLKLHGEFPGMKGTDIPLALRKVQEFVAVITPRYYAYQEEEVRRLQAAGAFSDAALPLIREEALQRLVADFPTVGEVGIKQLLGMKE